MAHSGLRRSVTEKALGAARGRPSAGFPTRSPCRHLPARGPSPPLPRGSSRRWPRGRSPGMVQATNGDGPGEEAGRWVPIREAARLLGRDPKAIRARVERGTLRWRPAGNHGREVYVTPDMEARGGDGPREVPGDDPAAEAEAV